MSPDGAGPPLPELEAWVGLHLVPGIGPRRFWALLRRLGSAEAAYGAGQREFAAAGVPAPAWHRLQELKRRGAAAAELERARALGARVVRRADADYPPLLGALPDPPPVLYVWGRLPGPTLTCVAVVGTRSATPYGRAVARALGRDLALAGAAVVSGLARGIDAAAHRGALEGGGATVAVLGSGLDVPYPPENRGLLTQIVDGGGAAVSQWPLGTPARAGGFLARNRTISGMSCGVVVVEAGASSGALSTAAEARRQGRPVFAVPGPVIGGLSRGCHALLREGAGLVEEAADVLAVLGAAGFPAPALTAAGRAGPSPPALPEGLAASERRVLEAVSPGGTELEEILRRSGLGAAEAAAALSCLELYGLVRRAPGQVFLRV
ncbi:MAG: DNA-processing protein DprA [Acetobacteraceae bacterium]|nr:DNA-processing protein DprA [Acetobacteraceae bacterium]